MASTQLTVRRMSRAVQIGEDRLRNFRAARIHFLKAYAGQFYDREKAKVGDEPLNMIFNAISTLVPNLVTNFPKSVVTSKYLAYRDYAETLALALDHLGREIDLRSELRRWIVDSFFAIGIMKTGIATSNDLVTFSEDEQLDPGTPYASVVDFDDFILDPKARRLEEANFAGHRVRVPRQMVLDSGLLKNDLVEKLPSAWQIQGQSGGAAKISQRAISQDRDMDLQDDIILRELWIPAAQAIVTIPAGPVVLDDYLRVEDYDGPEEGPLTYLALTQPMPDNPMPIAPVGIWYDLHVAANRMATKIMQQADRQKDILGYKPSAADDAQSIIDASDGEAVALMDPEGAKIYSFGGQQASNEAHMGQLSYWFNLATGNTDQLGGYRSDADTATQANILQGNAAIRVEDMRDLVYIGTRKIHQKLAWYLHTDPLISLPLIRTVQMPSYVTQSPDGPILVPPKKEERQVELTPEVRRGEFLDFHFGIEEKSMSRMDPAQRLQKMLLFAGKILPSAAQAAMVCKQMGTAFSFSKFVTCMAKELDIEWIDEVFYDPEFQAQLLAVQRIAPQPDNAKVTNAALGGGLGAALQNGQPANVAVTDRDADMGLGVSPETMSAAQPAEPLGTF